MLLLSDSQSITLTQCEHRANAFKDQYRQYDVLIMDDVQFIANTEKTQEEFQPGVWLETDHGCHPAKDRSVSNELSYKG